MASFYRRLYQASRALLVDAREKAALTRAQLAERFGQSEALVVSYEYGDRLLDPAEFISVCRAIAVDPCGLLKRAEAESENGSIEPEPVPEIVDRSLLASIGSLLWLRLSAR
jgi:transcriptional regulator with XRE-family HTH domain